MKITTVSQLCAITGGTLLYGKETVIDRVVTDSREGGAQALYIPIIGATNDGHAFMKNALDNGCAGTLTSDEAAAKELIAELPDAFFILVPDTEKALHAIAK